MATTFEWGVGTAVNISHYAMRGTGAVNPGTRWNESLAYFELSEATAGAESWKRILTTGLVPLPVARGDVLVANSALAWVRLALGASGTYFRSNGTDPLWAGLTLADATNQGTTTQVLHGNAAGAVSFAAVALAADVTGTLPVANGGTGTGTYVLGDTLYSDAANSLARLAGQITTTRKFLRQTGTGLVSAAPAWDTILAADVPGSALTAGNDTNVTLTTGGTPATALLAAASITAGWSGTLAVARGGTGLASGTSGGVLGFTAAGTLASSAALTANALLLGGGAGATPTSLGAATNGQLPIGSTGAAPVLAGLTAGTGITVTNGAGSITIASTVSGGASTADAFITVGNPADLSASRAITAGANVTLTDGGANSTMTIKSKNSFWCGSSAISIPAGGLTGVEGYYILYPGSSVVSGTLSYTIKVDIQAISGGTWTLDILDKTNTLTLATLTGVTTTGIKDLGTVSNVPTGAARLDLKVTQTVGVGNTITPLAWFIQTTGN